MGVDAVAGGLAIAGACALIYATVLLRRVAAVLENLGGEQLGGENGDDRAVRLPFGARRLERALSTLASHGVDRERRLREAIRRERVKTLQIEMYAEQVEDARRRLAAANAELEAFTYAASHDLAAPLKTIEAFAGFLLDDHSSRLDPEGLDNLRRIHRNAVRLQQLIGDLLALSRLSRPPEVEPEPYPLADLVADVAQEVREQMPGRVAIGGSLPEVAVPRPRIRQVLWNLISNGLRHNDHEEPKVTVEGWLEGELVVVRVTDNGVGIPSRLHEEIFGLFERVDPERPGTGAGLAIARRAIRSLGGEIWVERSAPGKGSTFAIAFPAVYRPEAPAPSWHEPSAVEMRR